MIVLKISDANYCRLLFCFISLAYSTTNRLTGIHYVLTRNFHFIPLHHETYSGPMSEHNCFPEDIPESD